MCCTFKHLMIIELLGTAWTTLHHSPFWQYFSYLRTFAFWCKTWHDERHWHTLPFQVPCCISYVESMTQKVSAKRILADINKIQRYHGSCDWLYRKQREGKLHSIMLQEIHSLQPVRFSLDCGCSESFTKKRVYFPI